MTKVISLRPRLKERSTYSRAFKEGIRHGQTEKALKLLNEAHAEGDARAAYALASWYIHGKAVNANLSKATRLLRLARRSGIREAAYDLAYAYEAGKGVPKSLTKAFKLYVEAAIKGDKDAILAVARCVYHGLGVSRSKELGLLLQLLAEADRR